MEEVFGFCGCGAKHPVYAKDSLLTEQFINIETLKTSKKLKPGMVVETLGYYEVNDGGSAKYIIRDKKEDDVESDSIIFLNSGFVAEKIKDSILKFHSVADSSATYIAEFPNGKNMIIDNGTTSQWETIKKAIDSLGITKFDYMILTHFHSDHIGNIENIINNYDVSNIKCWIGMKPDFENFGDKIEETEEEYESTITFLKSKGINPIVPENNSFEIISDDVKLHFLNTDSTLAVDYYSQLAEWHDTGKTNLNLFSLVTEIIHKNVVILSTGDIEKATEKAITPFLRKCNVMSVPHHGTNRDVYKPFYYATMPEYAICSYMSDSEDWVRIWYGEYMCLKEIGSKIINGTKQAVNGLFTFISNGNTINTDVIGTGDNDTCKIPRIYGRFEELIKYTTQEKNKITLTQLFENMDNGSLLCGDIVNVFKTDYETLYNDLLAIFPMLDSGYQFEIYKSQTNANRRSIKIFNYNYEFKAIANNIDNWTLVSGGGDSPSDINGINNLINTILKLPKGHYRCNYQDDVGDILSTSGFYSLSIDVVTKTSTQTCAIVYAVLRHTGSTTSTKVAMCYINTASDPQYVWHKLS